MNFLKQSLLGLYQTATSRSRMRRLRELSRSGRAPVSILFYHRIADTNPNDWTMPVRLFEWQIDWLRERFDFVTLREAQRRLSNGASYRPAVAITFDDGYSENCEAAIPFLLERNVPFTYFVSTQIVRDQTGFPHDLEAGIRLRPNTITELRSMADAGVEIGAHTRTHPDLGSSIDPAWLHKEIVGSIEDIESWTGRRPRYFAFPFGQVHNMTSEAMRVAHDAGIEAVCSAYGAYNLPDQISEEIGPFHLRRVHADPEAVRFKNWMTFDTRKLTADDPIDDDRYLDFLRMSDDSEPMTLPFVTAEVANG